MPQQGLSFTPGWNTGREYQRLSEENLNAVGGIADRQAGLANSVLGAGVGQMGKWGQRSDALYGALAGLASKEPKWYADRAAVNSNQAFDESKGVLERTMSRMGINPNSGRFAGLQQKWGLARAANEAGAKTRAGQEAEQIQFQRQRELLNPAQAAYARGTGLLTAASAPLSAAQSGLQTVAGAYDTLATEKGMEESYNPATEIFPDLAAEARNRAWYQAQDFGANARQPLYGIRR